MAASLYRLPALAEVSLLPEVLDGEQCSGAFTCSRRHYGGVHIDKSFTMEEVPAGFNDLRPYEQNVSLTGGPHPQMPVVKQELNPVFFEAYGIVVKRLRHDLTSSDA